MSAHSNERAQIAHAVIALLAERWPVFALYQHRRQPLKLGIHIDILTALDGVITPAELRLGLTFYCSNPVYLQRLRAGAARVGLDGGVSGYVTADEAQRAADRLASIRLRIAGRKAAKAAADTPVPVVVEAIAVPAGPKRLSMADLKAAAIRRKTSTPVSADAEVC
jgi:sRNA-binding protein